MQILGYASHHALDYFWSVMPTHTVARAVDTFQNAIELALDEILSPPAFDVPDCRWERCRREHSISQLPARYGGCNLANQQCLAPAAYLATTCAVLRDPWVANLKGHLSRYVEDAFKAFYDTFEGLHRVQVPPLTNGFPADTVPFAFFMRYYLGFPRLLRKGRPTAPIIEVGAGPVREEELVVPHVKSVGYVEEICSLSHAVRATLGPTGKHEISCPSTFAARYRAHGMLTQAAQLAANRLDCVPSFQRTQDTGGPNGPIL